MLTNVQLRTLFESLLNAHGQDVAAMMEPWSVAWVVARGPELQPLGRLTS